MNYLIRVVVIALLNPVLGFLFWNMLYYHREHCFIIPKAAYVHIYDVLAIMLVTGIVIGIMTIL